jgi:hypothetical protein
VNPASKRRRTPGRGDRYASLVEEDKEHPARTAGRYVRAAGVAIRKERERLAAESARRAAEAAEAEKLAPPVQPPPAAIAPPPSATTPPPPAAATKKPSGRQAAPPPSPKPMLDRLLWWGFLIAVVATGLAALNIDTVMSGTSKLVLRLALGGIFLGVSLLLLTNWHRASERLVAKLMKKFWGMDHPVTGSGRFMRRIARDLMTLLGIVWLAAAVFEILRAFTKM